MGWQGRVAQLAERGPGVGDWTVKAARVERDRIVGIIRARRAQVRSVHQIELLDDLLAQIENPT